jgi:hypothetical protein
MFGKYNGFVSKASGFCMHVFSSISLSGTHQRKVTVAFNNIHVAVDLVSFHLFFVIGLSGRPPPPWKSTIVVVGA